MAIDLSKGGSILNMYEQAYGKPIDQKRDTRVNQKKLRRAKAAAGVADGIGALSDMISLGGGGLINKRQSTMQQMADRHEQNRRYYDAIRRDISDKEYAARVTDYQTKLAQANADKEFAWKKGDAEAARAQAQTNLDRDFAWKKGDAEAARAQAKEEGALDRASGDKRAANAIAGATKRTQIAADRRGYDRLNQQIKAEQYRKNSLVKQLQDVNKSLAEVRISDEDKTAGIALKKRLQAETNKCDNNLSKWITELPGAAAISDDDPMGESLESNLQPEF